MHKVAIVQEQRGLSAWKFLWALLSSCSVWTITQKAYWSSVNFFPLRAKGEQFNTTHAHLWYWEFKTCPTYSGVDIVFMWLYMHILVHVVPWNNHHVSYQWQDPKGLQRLHKILHLQQHSQLSWWKDDLDCQHLNGNGQCSMLQTINIFGAQENPPSETTNYMYTYYCKTFHFHQYKYVWCHNHDHIVTSIWPW